jgi:hypothetical protein
MATQTCIPPDKQAAEFRPCTVWSRRAAHRGMLSELRKAERGLQWIRSGRGYYRRHKYSTASRGGHRACILPEVIPRIRHALACRCCGMPA